MPLILFHRVSRSRRGCCIRQPEFIAPNQKTAKILSVFGHIEYFSYYYPPGSTGLKTKSPAMKIGSLCSSTTLFALLCVVISACRSDQEAANANGSSKKVVVGYVPGYNGVFDVTTIDAEKLTHINYAFVNVNDSMAWLTNLATDTVNFRMLNTLKSKNPDLKIMISIGGWSWSENFSDAVLTDHSRKKFAYTGKQIVARYNLDGIDIDWEYPGMRGEDNVFRAEDRQNFTMMFKAIRESLDSLAAETEKKYFVTAAVPCFPGFLTVTEMGKAAEFMDFVNLMAYDFYVGGPRVGHHSNLFPSENDSEDSGDKAFRLYTDAGVPAEKLVLGVPFYGRSWFMKTADNRGVNREIDSVTRGGGFTFVKDSMMVRPGFVRYWDAKAKSPYLWNESTRQLVVFDDEESIRLKCDYVKEKGMRGLMFWQYASDPKEYLINAIHQNLK
jgi:chitinase